MLMTKILDSHGMQHLTGDDKELSFPVPGLEELPKSGETGPGR